MRAYLIRRILLIIPTVFLVSLGIFYLVRLIPGDVIDAMQPSSGDVQIDRAAVAHTLGLDAPTIVQFGRWLGIFPSMDGRLKGILERDFGVSWIQRVAVAKLLANKWPLSIELGLMGMLFALLIAMPIGVYSALRQDTPGDHIGRALGILCISVPDFWVATLVVVLPSIWWGIMPPIAYIRFGDDPVGNLKMMLLPSLILGMGLSGIIMRMTRTVMLEVLRQDYVRTAWAKGLKERVIVLRHILKNASIPIVTLLGTQIPAVIGGTVIIEQIFNLPGMGRLLVDAIKVRDVPLISGIILIFAFVVSIFNLLTDLTYGMLDPRIQHG
jgi:peptide/nickel transport system permease protein